MPIDFGTDADLIGVGPGIEYDSFVAVGLAGLISTVDGETATVLSPVNVTLRAVTRRESRLLAVGDQGSILVSDDAGQSWSARVSGTSSSLIAIVHAQLSGVDFVVAVGVEVIVVSADAGETWTQVTAPAQGWGTLRGVFATNERVYAVGDAGVGWSSATPAGLWNIEALGTTANLLGGGAHYADTGSGPSESEALLIAAADNSVIVRDSSGWSTRALELEGDVIGFSGGYLLTSTGAVYDLDGTGIASRLPSDFTIEVEAIHADSGGVLAVGKAGKAERIYFQPCVGGRPLIDEGQACVASLVERADWIASVEGDESARVVADPAQAERWASAALDEHASVGSFALHSLELVSLGAPAELIAEVQAAMADEVRHAALGFGLAQRRGGGARGPGRLAISPRMLARYGDAQAIALALLEQGCVNETLAACQVRFAALTCEDPEAGRVLEILAVDEQRHAALAWKTLRWLIDHHPQLREPLRRRLLRIAATQPVGPDAEQTLQTLRELIIPLARQLLGPNEPEPTAKRAV